MDSGMQATRCWKCNQPLFSKRGQNSLHPFPFCKLKWSFLEPNRNQIYLIFDPLKELLRHKGQSIPKFQKYCSL